MYIYIHMYQKITNRVPLRFKKVKVETKMVYRGTFLYKGLTSKISGEKIIQTLIGIQPDRIIQYNTFFVISRDFCMSKKKIKEVFKIS